MKKLVPLILALIAFPAFVYCQTTIDVSYPKDEIVEFDGKKVTKPYLRFKHFIDKRSSPGFPATSEKRISAINDATDLIFRASKKSLVQAQQPEWECLGPYSVGGRVKSIAIDPRNPSVVYVGAAAGGIWKTLNGGGSWEPIFDFQNGIGFGSITLDPKNPDIIYAATGEAVLNSAAPMYYSAGVFKSADAGDSWKSIGLSNVGAFSKIYVHPKNSNLIVAGGVGVHGGFYVSKDAGVSWEKSDALDKSVSDISIIPDDENEYFVGILGGGVYHTTDLGETWTAKNQGFPAGIGRVSVQAAPSDCDILWALMEIKGVGKIFKSENRGETWTMSHNGDSDFFRGQGWYNNYIMVHPENSDIAFAGGIDLWKTDDGSYWRNITHGYGGGSVHVDHHCGAFNPQKPSEIYIGNDGGVYKSQNLGSDFQNMNNGLEITQFYSFDFNRNEENMIFGGTQDNGTLGNYISSDFWSSVAGGDGFQTVVDYENPDLVYGEMNYGGTVLPYRRNINQGSFKILDDGINSSDFGNLWDPPLIIHPTYSSVLYHGRMGLYLSYSNGDIWREKISPRQDVFTAIAVSTINEYLVYAGDRAGGMIVTKDHFENIEEVGGNGLPSREITDIECSMIEEETAFVTVSGFGAPHVYKTANAGDSWTSVSDNLPDIPCNAIQSHPENHDWLFVGTDIGVFATFNGGQTWLPYGTNLPRTIITDLEIFTSPLSGDLKLRAGTFGRSIWQTDIPTEAVTSLEITSPAGGETLIGTSNYRFSWYGFDLPVKVEITYDGGENWITVTGGVNGYSVDYKAPNKITYECKIRVSSTSEPSQILESKTFEITPVGRGDILAASAYGHVPYGIAWDGGEYLLSTSFYDNKLFKIDRDNLKIKEYVEIPGDSLFTDLTVDRETGEIYVHKMNSSGETGSGGVVLTLNEEAEQLRSYISPAKLYPIGLELADGGLIVCDRNGSPQQIYVVNPETGQRWSKYDNPYQEYLGPRGLCYDGERYLYQACTDFSPSGGLSSSSIIKIDKNDLEAEVDRIPLNNKNGYINCRGIEYDPRDKNFWVTDYGGNIYKIAGFETISNVEEPKREDNFFKMRVYPNPARERVTVALKTPLRKANALVEIRDLTGKVIISFNKELTEVGVVSMELNDVVSGLYYIFVYQNGKMLGKSKLTVIK